MITSNTNDNLNTSNNNTIAAATRRKPTTTTTKTTTTPSATPRHKRRLPTTFKFLNLLTYIRILILALALVSLILDAITISFQTNVMTLEYEDVARQAFLLLTPDLLAIGLIAFLFIYPSSLCCGASSSGSGGRSRNETGAAEEVEYVEEYYDYGDDEEEEGDRSRGRAGVEGGGGTALLSVTAVGQPTSSSATTTTAAETGAGKAMTRSQAQQQDASSPSPPLSPATYDDNDDSLQQERRCNSQNRVTPSHLQPPTFTHHSHQNLASSTNHNGRRIEQQLLHSSQDHDRITTASTFDTAATTLFPPSIRPSSAKGDDPTSKSTGTIKEKEQQQHTQGQPTAAAVTPTGTQAPVGASLAEMIAQEEMDETNRKRRRARLYTLVRVTFSLGLTILALYWPAGQFKPPMGKQSIPPSVGEHQPIYGNNTLTYNRPSPVSPLPSRTTPTFTAVPSPTSTPTSTISSGSGPVSTPQFKDDKEMNFLRASTDASTMGYYTGSRHKRGGHPKDSSWCAEEESYGDDESAAVYCRTKVIRPIVTYVWAVFLIVELCIAAMAGDFSKHGIRRRRQSFGDEGMEEYYRHPRENQQQQEEVVVVGGGDVEKLSGRETDKRHGQSVQSLAISNNSGAGTGAGAHQQQHHRRPGSRAGH